MSIEIIGIAQVKPLAGMTAEEFQRIVNHVLSRAARSGQQHRSTIGEDVSGMAMRYMSACTKSAPLTPAELALLNKDRPADQIVSTYRGSQEIRLERRPKGSKIIGSGNTGHFGIDE